MGKLRTGGSVSLSKRKSALKGENSKKMTLSRKLSISTTERALLDDDSGLGDSSLDSESTSTSSSVTNQEISLSKSMCDSNMLVGPVSIISPNDLTTINPQAISPMADFHTKEGYRDCSPNDRSTSRPASKRLRLDPPPPEEANELPGELTPSSGYRDVPPPLLSFKNVPAILSSIKPLQKASLVCIDPLAPNPTSKRPLAVSAPIEGEKIPKRKVKSVSPLEGNFPCKSSDGSIELQLINQPEEQHRARYQTEGSRGAVKDRSGQGHPTIKLLGYTNSSMLQVFVASDGGTVSPHLFYQACKVTGKNSTPCELDKVNGTAILKMQLLPENQMTVSCDCVGILKERNVDVEQRMRSCVYRAKKRSTKCRLVFRTVVELKNGAKETLQVVSQIICCTQLPGIPEISRKSVSECDVSGGKELFIIGKNLKDSEVIFQELNEEENEQLIWSKTVVPDKEYLQPTHIICEVPPYCNQKIKEEVKVQIVVVSGGKTSEPSMFKYTPLPEATEALQSNSYQLQNLPKGVSPSAVELNMLYTKSANGLPTKESTSILPETRPLNPPVRVSRVLATVAPEIRPVSVLPTTRKNASLNNTLTTSTILTPRPSLSEEQRASREFTVLSKQNIEGISNEANEENGKLPNLDHLMGTLNRVIKSKSSEIRTMIVESLMGEIVGKMNDEKEPLTQMPSQSNSCNELFQSLGNIESPSRVNNIKAKDEEQQIIDCAPLQQTSKIGTTFYLRDVPIRAMKIQNGPTISRKTENISQNVNSQFATVNEQSGNLMTKWVVNNQIYQPFVKVNVNDNPTNVIKMDSFNKNELSQPTPAIYKTNTEQLQGTSYSKPNHEVNSETKAFFEEQCDLMAIKHESLELTPAVTKLENNSGTANTIHNKSPIGVNAVLMTTEQASQYQQQMQVHQSQAQQQILSYIPKKETVDCLPTVKNMASVQSTSQISQPHYAMQIIPEATSCQTMTVDSQVISQTTETLVRNPRMSLEVATPSLVPINDQLSIPAPHMKPEHETLSIPQTNVGLCTMSSKNTHVMNNTFVSCQSSTPMNINNSSSARPAIISDPLLCQTSNQISQLNSTSLEANCSVPVQSSVPMPPEVTNAISNLSETELLNIFNPSCFDNV